VAREKREGPIVVYGALVANAPIAAAKLLAAGVSGVTRIYIEAASLCRRA
jgi:hypothetical protein